MAFAVFGFAGSSVGVVACAAEKYVTLDFSVGFSATGLSVVDLSTADDTSVTEGLFC